MRQPFNFLGIGLRYCMKICTHKTHRRFASYQIPVFQVTVLECLSTISGIIVLSSNLKKGTWTDDDIIHFIMMILHCTFYNFVFQVTLWIQVFLRVVLHYFISDSYCSLSEETLKKRIVSFLALRRSFSLHCSSFFVLSAQYNTNNYILTSDYL